MNDNSLFSDIIIAPSPSTDTIATPSFDDAVEMTPKTPISFTQPSSTTSSQVNDAQRSDTSTSTKTQPKETPRLSSIQFSYAKPSSSASSSTSQISRIELTLEPSAISNSIETQSKMLESTNPSSSEDPIIKRLKTANALSCSDLISQLAAAHPNDKQKIQLSLVGTEEGSPDLSTKSTSSSSSTKKSTSIPKNNVNKHRNSNSVPTTVSTNSATSTNSVPIIVSTKSKLGNSTLLPARLIMGPVEKSMYQKKLRRAISDRRNQRYKEDLRFWSNIPTLNKMVHFQLMRILKARDKYLERNPNVKLDPHKPLAVLNAFGVKRVPVAISGSRSNCIIRDQLVYKDKYMPVICETLTAIIHLDKLFCPGTFRYCIEFEDTLITPLQLLQKAGFDYVNNWQSLIIACNGKSLKMLMKTSKLNFADHRSFCTGQCERLK